MLTIVSLLFIVAAILGISMAVRSIQAQTGTGTLRSATASAVDIQCDLADNKIKYKDPAGIIQSVTGSSGLKSAFSTGTVSAGYAADTYIQGSGIAIPTGAFVAGARYTCVFDMVKTAAGTATPIVVVRIGTAGTTSDAAILTFTFAAGTAAVDTGTFVVTCHFRTVGSGTSAVLVGTCEIRHALAATGLTSTGASGQGQIAVVSSGFDSTIAGTTIGVSFNGGASFSGTCTLAEAEFRSY